jgi:hypothetical protein
MPHTTQTARWRAAVIKRAMGCSIHLVAIPRGIFAAILNMINTLRMTDCSLKSAAIDSDDGFSLANSAA